MSDLSVKEALDLYQRQSDSIHKIWAYFQVVSFAVLGYVFSGKQSGLSGSVYLVIGLGYLCFAMANQWVIAASQRELEVFSSAVEMAAAKSGEIGRTLGVKAISAKMVVLLHSSATAVVLFALFLVWSGRG